MDRAGAALSGEEHSGRLLFILGSVLALSHLGEAFTQTPALAGMAWKAGGVALLGLSALRRGARLAGLALLASAAGDILLEFSPPRWTEGMAAFGLAHLLYIGAFLRHPLQRPATAAGLAGAVGVVAASGLLLLWFWPDMGELLVPGLLYQAVITVMSAIALLTSAPVPARIGAVLFVVSDSLIALGLYKGDPAPVGSVWLTYALAQILLAYGLGRRASS